MTPGQALEGSSVMSIGADKDLQLPLSHMLRWKLRLKVTI